MAISNIGAEPAEVTGAYRPIIFDIVDDGTPPVLYCDIYFNGTYYSTISKTQCVLTNGAASLWRFDIQNAAQDYLGKFLARNGGAVVESADPMITVCHCQFRSSTLDTEGFIQPETPIPVQETDQTAAVSGGGLESDDFWVVNSAEQQEDADDLRDHLASFKVGSWADTAYPLTHRPALLKISKNDSDHFPILTEDDSVSPCSGSITLFYRLRSASDGGYLSVTADLSASDCSAAVNNIRSSTTPDGSMTTISWDRAPGATSYDVSIDGGTVSTSNNSYSLALDPGSHDISVTPQCDCGTGSGIDTTIIVPGTACPELEFSGVLPDGFGGTPYNASLGLVGTAPFTLISSTIPTWMHVSISGSRIYFTGTPDVDDSETENVAVSVQSCADTYDFSQDINLSSNTGNSICVQASTEIVGMQIFIKAIAASAVAGNVTVSITATTQYRSYSTTRLIPSGSTTSSNLKILYATGNSDETLSLLSITGFTPVSQAGETYLNEGDC